MYDGVRYIMNTDGHNVEIKTFKGKYEILIRYKSLFDIEKYYISYDEKYNTRIFGSNKKFFIVSKKDDEKVITFKNHVTNDILTIKYKKFGYEPECYNDLLEIIYDDKKYVSKFEHQFKNRNMFYKDSTTINHTDLIQLPLYDRTIYELKNKKESKFDKWKYLK